MVPVRVSVIAIYYSSSLKYDADCIIWVRASEFNTATDLSGVGTMYLEDVWWSYVSTLITEANL
jgi:hypothetical protein